MTIRLFHAIQAHPVLRIALGVLVAVGGVIALIIGAGHGGLIAVGVVLVAGGVTATLRGGSGAPGDD